MPLPVLWPNSAAARFSPTKIDSLQLWLDADAVTGLSDGDPVSTWSDLSDNGYDLSQSTGAKKPTFKTNIIHGKPVMRFDGTDDLLIRAAETFTGTAGMIWAVVQLTATIGEKGVVFGSADEATIGLHVFSLRPYHDAGSPNARGHQRNSDTADFIAGDSTILVSTPYIISLRSDGSSYDINLNDADELISVVTGADSGDWLGDTANRDNISVGGLKYTSESNFFKGDIAELCYFEGVPSAGDRTRLNRYASAKYGISI